MQTDRLFQMIYLLMNRSSIPARELAERFEVSVRTIYRDLDVLSSAGIPVYAARGKGGGIRMLEGFVLDRSVLSSEEQSQVLSALQTLAAANVQGSAEALEKFRLLFQKPEDDWLRVDFSDWGGGNSETFQTIRQAILNTARISFDYYAANGQMTCRTVEPSLLWFKHKTWYLIAYDPSRQAGRTFKLTRMKRVKNTGEPFDSAARPEGVGAQPGRFDPLTQSLGAQPEVETGFPQIQSGSNMPPIADLHLRIDQNLAYRIYDEFSEEQIRRESDGFHVTVSWPEDEWVYSYLLSYAEHLDVIAPKRIRDALRVRLENMLKRMQAVEPDPAERP